MLLLVVLPLLMLLLVVEPPVALLVLPADVPLVELVLPVLVPVLVPPVAELLVPVAELLVPVVPVFPVFALSVVVQPAQKAATASKTKSPKVLRIEFSPVTQRVICWRAASGFAFRFQQKLSMAARSKFGVARLLAFVTHKCN
jgi:hypothetical protein